MGFEVRSSPLTNYPEYMTPLYKANGHYSSQRGLRAAYKMVNSKHSALSRFEGHVVSIHKSASIYSTKKGATRRAVMAAPKDKGAAMFAPEPVLELLPPAPAKPVWMVLGAAEVDDGATTAADPEALAPLGLAAPQGLLTLQFSEHWLSARPHAATQLTWNCVHLW